MREVFNVQGPDAWTATYFIRRVPVSLFPGRTCVFCFVFLLISLETTKLALVGTRNAIGTHLLSYLNDDVATLFSSR